MSHTSNRQVQALVEGIRRRWRRRALVQGGALVLLVLITCMALGLALRVYAGAGSTVLWSVGAVGAVAMVAVAILFIVRPLRRDLSDRRIALFIEERVPGLEDRLNSAVEVGGAAAGGADALLLDRLLDDAATRVRMVSVTTLLDRQRERAFAIAAALALVAFLPFAYSALRTVGGAAGLAITAVAEPAPLFTVAPGSVEVEQGASQEIIVTFREAANQDVLLHWRAGDGPWQRAAMTGDPAAEAFLHEFYSIQDSIEYYVAYGEERSRPFTLALYTFPSVAGVDAVYTFPAYTGRPPRTETDAGDLHGLRGSTVTLTAHTTGDVARAEVVLDDDTTVPLADAGEGRFRGSLVLEEDRTYHVRLTDANGKTNKFPDRHLILPYDDAPPHITVEDPGRDVRANAVEEVLVAVRVEDDFGVEAVRLRYVVGAGEEQTIDLAGAEAGRDEVTGEHLFFLEDYGLEPGDVISYYVEAADGFQAQPAATDMFFVEVIPFDQSFRQQANAGGMPGGGGQPSGIVLTQQDLINATWKLQRARATMDPGTFDETRGGIVQAQRNLRQNITERLNNTAFSLELQMDAANRAVADHLRNAVRAMGRAVEDLEADRLEAALTPEREALAHLLKADALNKERQVAMNSQPGGGGGGGGMEERMTELMDLELDVSKDKYEIQQPGQQPGGGQQRQALDEALRKVQELARKQQNLAAQSRNEREAEDPKRTIERLQRDQDELRAQVQDLARTMQGQDPQQGGQQQGGQPGGEQQGGQQQGGQQGQGAAGEQLRRASEAMREAERALRAGDLATAEARQQQALDALDRLAQDLRLAGRDDARAMLDDLAARWDELQQQEERLGRDLRAADRAAQPDVEDLARLRDNRRAMQDNLRRFASEAEAVAERARREDPALANEAQNLLRRLQREELDAAMDASEEALARGWTDFAARKQDEIEASLDRVGEGVRALETRLPPTEEEAVARGLTDVRDLMRRLDDLRAQAEELRSEENGQPGGQQGGQPGGQAQGEGTGPGTGQGDGRARRAGEARLERGVQAARESLERLERDYGDNPAFREALGGLRRTLGRADFTGRLLEGDAADAFFDARIYAPLSGLEMDLAGRLDALALEKKLYGARKGDAPPAYQDLVERYYERLARGRQ